MVSNYSEQLSAFRFKVESEIKKRIDSGLVWDKTSYEDEEEFRELPFAQYQEDEMYEDYSLVLSEEDNTFKGISRITNEDYWFSLDEIPIESLCQILDTWDEKNN